MLDRAGLPLEGIAAAVSSGHASFAFLDLDIYGRVSSRCQRRRSPRSARRPASISIFYSSCAKRSASLSLTRATPCATECRGPSRHPTPALVREQPDERGTTDARLRRRPASGRRYRDGLVGADDLELPLLTSGVSTGEMLETINRSGAELAPLLDQLLLAIRHAHQGRAGPGSSSTTSRPGCEHRRGQRAVTPAGRVLPRHQRLLAPHGGARRSGRSRPRSVLCARRAPHVGPPSAASRSSRLGDGVMLMFDDPRGAVVACLGMVVALHEADGIGDSHVGIHTGPVLFQEGATTSDGR